MTGAITIENRPVGPGHPVLVVAELSANHGQKIDAALELIGAARDAGADAIKVQTYTADTMTLDSDAAPFVIGDGSPWTGRRLYELYQEAYTPWEWLPELQTAAREAGLIFFSTAFDPTSVETLEQLDVPVHKLASWTSR
jgi:pseudaminic acid synthase